ncbi:TRAP transporter small permease [Zobellella aerophila]|uniref:TRAP transporter small permease protein n=1 Tax=Zobellella aerophila TaxID=870480 RepID=A0ABP6VBW6_9GAMM
MNRPASLAARLWCNSAAVLQRLLDRLAALMLILMMLLTTVDVVGRYLFNRPVTGSAELIEIMLAAMIFCVLPTITWQQEHVAVDLTEHLLPRRLRQLRDRLYHLLMVVGAAYMAMTVWKLAERAARYETVTEYLAIPTSGIMFFIAGCLWLTAFTFLVLGVISTRVAYTGQQQGNQREAVSL